MENDTEVLYKKLKEDIKKYDTDRLLEKIKGMLNISNKEYENISFCILLIFWLETVLKEVLKNLILKSQKIEEKYPEFIDIIFNETTFSSKITIIEFIINKNRNLKEKFKDFFAYCRTLNSLRNQIFHTKLNDINYKGLPISGVETQRKMFIDLIEARLKMGMKL